MTRGRVVDVDLGCSANQFGEGPPLLVDGDRRDGVELLVPTDQIVDVAAVGERPGEKRQFDGQTSTEVGSTAIRIGAPGQSERDETRNDESGNDESGNG